MSVKVLLELLVSYQSYIVFYRFIWVIYGRDYRFYVYFRHFKGFVSLKSNRFHAPRIYFISFLIGAKKTLNFDNFGKSIGGVAPDTLSVARRLPPNTQN